MTIFHALLASEQNKLGALFPEYSIEFKSSSITSYGFRAAYRKLETRLFYDAAGGNVLPIVGVGGNCGRSNVHSHSVGRPESWRSPR